MSTPNIWPRLMKAKKASAYLDMSETKFRKLVKSGGIPEPRYCGSNVVWDKNDLDVFADILFQRTDNVPDLPVEEFRL